MRILILIVANVALAAVPAQAREVTFPQVWRTVSEGSKIIKSANAKAEAAGAASSRFSRHWLPRVYLGAQTYRTNDGGQNLFGLIGQRAVEAQDFAPDRLNNPGHQTFTRGAVGIDLPLFEGGGPVAMAQGADHLQTAAEWEARAAETKHFSETAKSYGSLLALESERRELSDLHQSVLRLLQRYEVGNKQNPVGYSGLLGLRTLSHRLEGLIAQNKALASANRAALEEMGMERDGWQPSTQGILEFANEVFPEGADSESPGLLAERAKADAAARMVAVERSRFLPRVGLFAEQQLVSGSRKTETAQAVGVYLSWSLFNPAQFGAVKEARLLASSAENFAFSSAERERAERRGLREGAAALKKNIALMDKSLELLTEQTKVAEGLFRNGSINALQLVEALARRTDLITSATEARIALLETEAARITKEQRL